MINFDEVICRKNTDCVKYDFHKSRNIPEDCLPLWIADMDFKVCDKILDQLNKRIEHGIFGYSERGEGFFNSIINWMDKRFNWTIEKEWIVTVMGVVPAINFLINGLTEPGDGILIEKPVYHPFEDSIKNNNRKVVNSSLILKDGKYFMDFEDLEKKIKDNNVKLIILCNPHNPVGRVWSREELIKFGEICLKHKVTIISDEIHQDLVYKKYKHTPIASISEELSHITITCTAPSKSFNIAGLQVSNIIIKNQCLREKFQSKLKEYGIGSVNSLGLVACEAAYKYGEQWLEEVIDYLEGNKEFFKNFIKEKLPQIKVIEPEGTYLLWVDFRGLGLNYNELEDLMLNKAKLWLDEGYIFGKEGQGFERINIACSRKILERALNQLEKAIKNI